MRNVLFLCTGNTARSILAEAILRRDGDGRFKAFSAGSMPKGTVNSLALKTLIAHGYPADGLRSKNWSEFATPDASKMDYVITVCDNAAGEACPYWPGQPITAHWGIADPAAEDGSDQKKQEAFEDAFTYLRARIAALIALPVETMDAASLRAQMHAIGDQEGSTMLQDAHE